MSFWVLFFLQIICVVNSARILGIMGVPSYSHQIAFQPLWRELSKRGHEVVVVTSNPLNDKHLKNLTEIDTSSTYKIATNFKYKSELFLLNNPFKFYKAYHMLLDELTAHILEMPQIKQLIRNKNEHFDLVMLEANFFVMHGFSAHFDCPLISISSFDSNHDLMGNPTHPVLYPSILFSFASQLSFMQRLASTLNNIAIYSYERLIRHHRLQELHDIYFKNSKKSISELKQSIDMFFYYGNPIFFGNRPLNYNTVNLGDGIHLNAPKKLPKEIENFLNNATNGVIYFSLGTNVKMDMLGSEVLNKILQVFKELPYKILWKYELKLENKTDNIKVVKWLPQQDVLRHRNIKLFITQGGIQSTEESIFSHVPMIGLPVFADQPSNMIRMEKLGMGLTLDWKTITKSSLKNAILNVILNKKYKKAVEKVAQLSKDQPMSGLEKAIWWTEYVIRHKGAKHFRSPVLDLPLYQYYLLDIIAFVAAVLLAFILIVKKCYAYFKRILPKKKCE